MNIRSMTRNIVGAGLAGAFVLLAVLCSESKGTLTVTTSPIPATVSIDGVPYGESPVTLALSAGTYELSFPDHGTQYVTPPVRTVSVEPGQELTVDVVYRNRLLVGSPGQGFALVDSILYYGTRDRMLRDGAVFDYIDGGAIVYLEHGLKETTHALYRNADGDEIVADIFDMGSRGNAEEAIHDEKICPPGFKPCGIGAKCKTYAYAPDFLMYFIKGRFLVFLSTTNDFLEDKVKDFAATIAAEIE